MEKSDKLFVTSSSCFELRHLSKQEYMGKQIRDELYAVQMLKSCYLKVESSKSVEENPGLEGSLPEKYPSESLKSLNGGH